ncbi:hypothetical protein TSUD_389680 [Trifolium subterraneum]|uniref:Uncharacterized protein n=1 Tax=Trifolium subterraneum TaxID=3900 RepID=A0A2Z6N5K0_TRISU|nr:hypothetical protein TSUD_389680 [Trifolium subterraneum]
MEPSTVLQQEMSNLLITETVNEQPKVQINSRLPVVPFDQMFPFFTPAIGPDKTNQLQALFDKYKKKTQQVTGDKRPRTEEIHSSKQLVPFHQLFPFLTPHIDSDKANQIQTLADQYELPFDQLALCLVPQIDHDKAIELQTLVHKYQVPLDQLFSSLIPQVDPDKVIELQTLAEKSKKFNLHVTVHEQPRIQINSSKLVVPSGPPFQSLDPHIDAGKATELQILAYKYKVC